MDTFLTLLSLLPFYALGALPSGYVIAKAHGIDIRNVGSGNVGATNVARSVGKKAGIYTLIIDVSKGLLGTAIGWLLSGSIDYMALAGFVVVCGHCCSFPPKLKGGKGVATALGTALMQTPLIAGIAFGTFVVIVFLTEFVSLASVSAVLIASVSSFILLGNESISLSIAAIALLVTYKHRSNLKKLSEGNEPKFSAKV